MTRKLITTNLKEIDGIRVVCGRCDAHWFLPLSAEDAPQKCISCKAKIPMSPIVDMMNRLLSVIELSKKSKFDVVFEVEQI